MNDDHEVLEMPLCATTLKKANLETGLLWIPVAWQNKATKMLV